MIFQGTADEAPEGQHLVFTAAELEAVRDFIDPRKLKAKRLKGFL
jgi:hypothetical protein